MRKFEAHLAALFCPHLYTRWLYRHNKGKQDWGDKKACLTLSFDCDYVEDIYALPKVLDLLRAHSFKASFACVGKLIEQYPSEHKSIIAEGHEIVNHTYTHPNHEKLNPSHTFNELTFEQQQEEIAKCHKVCENVLNYSPIGFRTPHFGMLHTKRVYQILKEAGYAYSSSLALIQSSTYGMPFFEQGIREIPVSICPKHPFSVFDTWHSFARGRGRHEGKNDWVRAFCELVELGVQTNSYLNVYFDPQDVASRKEFQTILEYLEEKRDTITVTPYEKLHREIYAAA